MQRLLTWIKTNFKFAIILMIMLFLALFSVTYAFLRGGTQLPVSISSTAVINNSYEYLPLAEILPGGSSTSSGATLGVNTKCLENQTAMAAVNLKISKELSNHEDVIKQIGHGGLMSKMLKEMRLNQEDNRHLKAMEALQQEYQALLSQINC